MNKLFRPKCLRRVLLCLALLFPIVYLCGGLFFALAGSHGNLTLAEVPQEVEISASLYTKNTMNGEGTEIPSQSARLSNVMPLYENSFTLDIKAEHIIAIYMAYYDDSQAFISRPFVYQSTGEFTNYTTNLTSPSSAKYCKVLILMGGVDYEVTSTTLIFANFGDTPYWEGVTMSDYLFTQPFASDNFITSLGKDLVDGSTKGFNPMNELFRSINTNIMHFDGSDNLAMFGLGYVYYAVNVLIVYEILILAVKLIMLPLRAVELFDKKEDI